MEGGGQRRPFHRYTVSLVLRADLPLADLVHRHGATQSQEGAFKGPQRKTPAMPGLPANQVFSLGRSDGADPAAGWLAPCPDDGGLPPWLVPADRHSPCALSPASCIPVVASGSTSAVPMPGWTGSITPVAR